MVESSWGGWLFLGFSGVLFLIAVLLAYMDFRKVEDTKNDHFMSGLLDFVRLFLSRFLVGEMLTSIYGLFLFILFAMTLTQWLPNGIQAGNIVFTSATVLYVLDVIFLSAWVYGPLRGKKERKKHPKTKYLIYGLSSPVSPRNPDMVLWDVNKIKNAGCEDLKRDRVFINIVPLYVSMYYHFPKLEKLFLLYSNAHTENKEATMNGLRAFFERAGECLGREHSECASFRIQWQDIFSNENEEILGGGCNEGLKDKAIEVRFIYIGSANDVMGIYDNLRKSEVLEELMEHERNDVTFHVTGGTAVTSAAMVLHAIKTDVHAEYLRQDAPGKEPEESLGGIDIDLFEDLNDIIREVREYFER